MAKLNEAKNFSLSFTKVVDYFILIVLLGWWMNWDIVGISWSIWLTDFAVSCLSVCVESVFCIGLLK